MPLIPELVQALSSTAGSPVTTYVLDGTAVSKRRTFASAFGDGNKCLCVVSDGATPPLFHTFIGTYNSGANSVTVNTTLKGTGNWGAGTRNIWVSPLEEMLAPWVDPNWPIGYVVRDTFGTLANRQVQWTALGGLANDFIIGTNPTGAAGNTQFQQQFDPPRRSGGTAAQRTIDTPTFSGASLTLSGNDVEVLGAAGTTDRRFRSRKVATDDYRLDVRIAGSWVEVLSGATFSYPVATAKESANATTGAVQTDTLMSITVPSSGSYLLSVFATLHAQFTSVIAGAPANVHLDLDQQIGAGTMAAVKAGDFGTSFGSGQGAGLYGQGVIHLEHHIVPALSTTYQFRMTPTASAGPGAGAIYICSGVQRHTLAAILTRTA